MLYSWEFHFIKSQFAGQLPQQYQNGKDATKVIPPNMNDMNKEEHSRYVSSELRVNGMRLRVTFERTQGALHLWMRQRATVL